MTRGVAHDDLSSDPRTIYCFANMRFLRRLARRLRAINRLLLVSTDPAPILRQFGAHVEHGNLHGPLVIHNADDDYSNLRIGRRVHLGRDVLLDLTAPLTIEAEATISMRTVILTHEDVGNRPLAEPYPRKVESTIIGAGAYIGAGGPGATLDRWTPEDESLAANVPPGTEVVPNGDPAERRAAARQAAELTSWDPMADALVEAYGG
jgi:hypothetical protein